MIPRTVFESEHEMLRDQVRRFFEREVAPHYAAWEKQGFVPREFWRTAGEAGMLCTSVPEEFGGMGADRKYAAILLEEQARGSYTAPGLSVHSELTAPYLIRYGTDAQKQRWLPKMVSGEAIGAIALTEPVAGSDLQSMRTTAVRDGDHYVVNGQKAFISNGYNADIVLLAVKTDPTKRAAGISILVVDTKTPGFSRGEPLHKLGCKGQDTSELFFTDMRIPVEDSLLGEGRGFGMLMEELAWERLQIAISAIASVEAMLEHTIQYTKERKAFGKSIVDFQANRFYLAEMKTAFQVARTFVDRCLELVCDGKLDGETAAMAKYWATDLACEVADRCLQLHGGYGYIMDYPIARFYVDARVTRIYGGTNEIMKEIIGRAL
jgi:alkylation response protein AidB-like acyl-CoA dehydrogenase